MASMEKIVRPFLPIRRDPTRTGTSRLVLEDESGKPKEPKENVKLAFGKPGGSAETTSGSMSLDATWYAGKVEREKKDP